MKPKLFQTLFLVLFFSLLLLVSGYWLFVEKNGEVTSIEEQRQLARIPDLTPKEVCSSLDDLFTGAKNPVGDFGKVLEAGLSDRFPLRLIMLKTSRWIDRQMIALAYLPLHDPVIPADAHSDVEVLRDRSRLIRMPTLYDAELEHKIDAAAANYDLLIKRFPELHFYAYYIQEVWDSAYHPLAAYFPGTDKGRSLQYFREKKPDGLNLGQFAFSSFDDIKWFYKTDHHWTMRGACRGYQQIYALLAQNYPGITPVVDCDHYMTVPGVQFLGSSARDALYPMQPEPIEVSTAPLPDHTILVDGKPSKYTHLASYLKGDFSTYPYTDHYRLIFGAFNKLVEYEFPASPQRNLLIIGSSYRTPVLPLVASHYRHTWVVDLRFVKDFRLGEFLNEHPVDDLLLLGEDNVIYQFDEWKLNP